MGQSYWRNRNPKQPVHARLIQHLIGLAALHYLRDGVIPLDIAMKLMAEGVEVSRLESRFDNQLRGN